MRAMHSSSELRLVAGAAAWVCAVRVGLWLVSFRKLQHAINFLTGGVTKRASGTSVAQLSWAVSAASRYVPQATCLTQAIALHAQLKRAGFQSRVRIGVAKEAGKFESHAWVENGDKIVIGNIETQRYAPILDWD